jgi:hypothetical protein
MAWRSDICFHLVEVALVALGFDHATHSMGTHLSVRVLASATGL